MKNRPLIVAGIISAFIYLLSSCGDADSGDRVSLDAAAGQDTSAKRGGYLVTIMGCDDCHSPRIMGANGPQLDPDRLLSGYDSTVKVVVPDMKGLPPGSIVATGGGFTGPWGTSFAANLTSDGTGIGNWSLEQFKKALTHGKFKGIDEERMLFPPMPWENYQHIEEADLKAIFAYLKSTKPVKNVVPAYMPPVKTK